MTRSSPSSGSRQHPIRSRLLVIVAAVAGVLAGRAIAYDQSLGGFTGITGAALLSFGLVLAVVVLTVIGIVVARRHDRPQGSAGKPWFAAAVALIIATLGGSLTAPLLGGTYHEPVVLSAPAGVHLQLDPQSMSFVAHDQGQAECRSQPDGRTVVSISALDLGELGPGTMRAGLTLTPNGGSAAATLELFIDGGDLAEGSAMVSWSGAVSVTALNVDQSNGQLSFGDLPLLGQAGKPAADPAASTASLDWPAVLSGQLSWTCQPWTAVRPLSEPPRPSVVL